MSGKIGASAAGIEGECPAPTGFLAVRVISAPALLSLAFLPVTQENQGIAVMVAGHDFPGVITVSTDVRECDERCLSLSRLDEEPLPGSFVYLEVLDTGPGMDEETRKRLFEPFHTTRFMGPGTVVRMLFPVIDYSNKGANEPAQCCVTGFSRGVRA